MATTREDKTITQSILHLQHQTLQDNQNLSQSQKTAQHPINPQPSEPIRQSKYVCPDCGNIYDNNLESCHICGCPSSEFQLANTDSQSFGIINSQQGQRQRTAQQPNTNQQQTEPQLYGYEDNPKSKTTAGVLAILLGGLGIHYFYISKPIGGIICIAISLFTCAIWSLIMAIQGIMILVGSDEDFKRKYVDSDSVFPLF